VVAGDVGEGVDRLLVDEDPARFADLASDPRLNFFDAGDGHGGRLERPP
jgi:hypothetical protein